jgi:hypothetical protein
MTGGPPRRWPDDSPEEDAEAYRAAELARLEQWMREQKLRPLTDALGAAGVAREPGECWAGPVILPDWWDQVPEPGHCCPWCQRPGVPSPCPECREARAADADPPSLWAWWASLAPAARRLHIAASYGTDPWSGRHCSIRMEWTSTDAEGQIRTTHPPYLGAAPAGVYWGTRGRG